VGALFLFLECAGRVKPWKFNDTHALDVRILGTEQWLLKTKRDMNDLDRIMKKQLRYYLDKDLRIYDRIEPNYEIMKTSVSSIDSILSSIVFIYDDLRNTYQDSLESIPVDTSVSYRKIIETKSQKILESQELYLKAMEKLKKGFKKDQKYLFIIEESYKDFPNTLYDLKFKRQKLNPILGRLNTKLNRAIFNDDGYTDSKSIIGLSKKIEDYKTRMDRYEKFLSNIDKIAVKEAGGYIVLSSSKKKNFKYIIKYKEGLEEYLDILHQIRKMGESI
tara:strand:- start:174 stop:1001 length:828 start_codon:yes stop_codon:yes gene_type:complete